MNEQTTQSNMQDVSNSASGDNKEQKEQERKAEIARIKGILKNAIGLGEDGELRTLLNSNETTSDKPQYANNFYSILEDEEKRISACIDQFDTEVLITTVVGMLKAGKSTLISLLAHNKDAEPVGYGIDTTLRPSLVHMWGEKEKEKDSVITVYGQHNQGSDEDDIRKKYKRDIHDLLNRLRGVEVDNGNLWQKDFPLDNDHLEKLLCKKPHETDNLLAAEPLLVVVNLKYDEKSPILARGDRCLLDLPGLDSHIADICKKESTEQAQAANDDDKRVTSLGEREEKKKTEHRDSTFSKYHHLVTQSDVVLLMQSSTAPLNQPAYNAFMKICGEKENCMIWHVYNDVVSKYWRASRSLESEIRKQHDDAHASFFKPGQKESFCNFGMAYSAYFEKDEEFSKTVKFSDGDSVTKESLLAQSGYHNFEENLTDDLIKHGWQTRVIHCCEQWKAEMRAFKGTVNSHKKFLNQSLEGLEKKQGRYADIKRMIKEEKESTYPLFAINYSLNDEKLADFSGRIDEWILNAMKKCPKVGNNSFSGEVLDSFISQLEGECKNGINNFLQTELKISDLMCESSQLDNEDKSGETRRKPAHYFVHDELQASIDRLRDKLMAAAAETLQQRQESRDENDASQYVKEIEEYFPKGRKIPMIDCSPLEYELQPTQTPSFPVKSYAEDVEEEGWKGILHLKKTFNLEKSEVKERLKTIKEASQKFVEKIITKFSKKELEKILTENVKVTLQTEEEKIGREEERLASEIENLKVHLRKVEKVETLIGRGEQKGNEVEARLPQR